MCQLVSTCKFSDVERRIYAFVNKTIIGFNIDLLPNRHQAII